MAHRSSAVWQQGTLTEIVEVTPSVRRLVFACGQHPSGAHWLAGTHVDFEIPGLSHEPIRSYSVIEDGRRPGRLSVGVRLDPHSRGGSAYMWSLQVGDTVRMTGPQQSFDLTTARVPCILIAGGIGITPIISMARVLAERGQEYSIHFASRSRTDMPFADQLANEHGDRLHLAISEEGVRLDLAAIIARAYPDAELYVCGPRPMLTAVNRAWNEAARDPSKLRFETFGSSGEIPTQDFELEIPRLGTTVTVSEHSSALEALESAGIEVMSDCLRGECGLCVAPILGVTGQVDHRDVFLSQRQKDLNEHMALCVSRGAGRICIDIAGRSADDITV